jgi:hypothetical protein
MEIKHVDEIIANGHREVSFTKWANSIHCPLIVSKDRGSDKGTFTILVMLKRGMGKGCTGDFSYATAKKLLLVPCTQGKKQEKQAG